MKIDRTKWRPITIAELKEMIDEEKSKLLSVAWDENNRFRCKTIGITNVKIKPSEFYTDYINLEWSDNDGDPQLWSYTPDTKIDRISGTDDYRYGLYKEI